jgi:hypothetical protein
LGGRITHISHLQPRRKMLSGVCSSTAASEPPPTMTNAESCSSAKDVAAVERHRGDDRTDAQKQADYR